MYNFQKMVINLGIKEEESLKMILKNERYLLRLKIFTATSKNLETCIQLIQYYIDQKNLAQEEAAEEQVVGQEYTVSLPL